MKENLVKILLADRNQFDLSSVFHYSTDKTYYYPGQSRFIKNTLFSDPANFIFCQ
jgi:hypothetical protein